MIYSLMRVYSPNSLGMIALAEDEKDSDATLFRDRSIFMGIRDREISNGTAGYFDPPFERGHGLF